MTAAELNHRIQDLKAELNAPYICASFGDDPAIVSYVFRLEKEVVKSREQLELERKLRDFLAAQ